MCCPVGKCPDPLQRQSNENNTTSALAWDRSDRGPYMRHELRSNFASMHMRDLLAIATFFVSIVAVCYL